MPIINNPQFAQGRTAFHKTRKTQSLQDLVSVKNSLSELSKTVIVANDKVTTLDKNIDGIKGKTGTENDPVSADTLGGKIHNISTNLEDLSNNKIGNKNNIDTDETLFGKVKKLHGLANPVKQEHKITEKMLGYYKQINYLEDLTLANEFLIEKTDVNNRNKLFNEFKNKSYTKLKASLEEHIKDHRILNDLNEKFNSLLENFQESKLGSGPTRINNIKLIQIHRSQLIESIRSLIRENIVEE